MPEEELGEFPLARCCFIKLYYISNYLASLMCVLRVQSALAFLQRLSQAKCTENTRKQINIDWEDAADESFHGNDPGVERNRELASQLSLNFVLYIISISGCFGVPVCV